MRADHRSVWYVPNGAAQGESDSGHPIEGDSPTVLLYTRFVEHAPADVCEVWRVVHEAMPSARLVVVGQGIRGEEHVLARMLAQHGLDSTTEMVHWVPADQLKRFFHAADVAMMPVRDSTLARAKSPARLLDLMAAGVPIACHSVGEYEELLHEGPSGLLVPPGDNCALGLAVVRLLSDDALRRRIGQAAKRRVQSAFSWRELAEVVEQAYTTPRPGSDQ